MPECRILVVEADDDQGDGSVHREHGRRVAGARRSSATAGAGPEQGNEAADYDSTSTHTNIITFVAAGDDGYDDGGSGPDYPSTSPHAFGVGGTSLTKTATTRAASRDGVERAVAARAAAGFACRRGRPRRDVHGRMTSDVSAAGTNTTRAYNQDAVG